MSFTRRLTVAVVAAVLGGTAAAGEPEVLCERVRFGENGLSGSLAASANGERPAGDKQSARDVYALSSVTVPPGGWTVQAVAIYTVSPSRPEGWLKLGRARLNVLPKMGERPGAKEDPRAGREVEVAVRKVRQVKDRRG